MSEQNKVTGKGKKQDTISSIKQTNDTKKESNVIFNNFQLNQHDDLEWDRDVSDDEQNNNKKAVTLEQGQILFNSEKSEQINLRNQVIYSLTTLLLSKNLKNSKL